MELLGQKNEPTGPCRELFWHEMNDAQKINKLAQGVEYLAIKLKEAGEVITKLKRHSHSGDEITVPMNDDRSDYDRFSESYFFKNPLGKERP
jgi:hypothetical protein